MLAVSGRIDPIKSRIKKVKKQNRQKEIFGNNPSMG
jgi:hypothetical protein